MLRPHATGPTVGKKFTRLPHWRHVSDYDVGSVGEERRNVFDTHFLATLGGGTLDLDHAFVALMIGVAGGFFLAEFRLDSLRRALRRVTGRPPRD